MSARNRERRRHRCVLNVGGQTKAIRIPKTYDGFEHVLLDIVELPDVDIVHDARELKTLDRRFEAVYCAHNLEHFYPEEVPVVLAGFAHVLRPGGTLEVRVPDGDLIYDELLPRVGLDGTAYMSPEGPITPRDMICGHQASIEKGNPYMAHHIVFRRADLLRVILEAGFQSVRVRHGNFELEAHAVRP